MGTHYCHYPQPTQKEHKPILLFYIQHLPKKLTNQADHLRLPSGVGGNGES
jgi:hypothetical protein